MTHPYMTLLRRPDVAVRLIAVLLSATTIGMMSLTLVLCVRGWTGSFALAGAASGLFSAGNATGITVQGYLLDRYGPRRVIGLAGTTFAAASTALVISGQSGAPAAVLLVLAAVAGLAVPAVTTAVRAWLPAAVHADRDRGSSYALLSLVFQIALVAGPLLVSLCVLLSGPPLAALVAAVLVAGASLAYPRTSPAVVTSSRPAPSTTPRPLLGRGLRTVLAVTALTGAAYGTLLVLLPTLMTTRGTPALAGVLLTTIAVGEACGALAYGARRWPGRRPRHLLVTLSASVLASAAVLLAAPATLLLAVALLTFGLASGPVAIVLSALLDDVAAPGWLARAYSLLVTTTLVAIAAGSAATGALLDHVEPHALLAVPTALTALAVAWTAARRPALLRTDAGPRARRAP